MKHKLLRRRCIIREYDYSKIAREALDIFEGQPLYDRVSFEPITRDALEKQALLCLLKGQDRWQRFSPTRYPIHTLELFKDYLYDTRYLGWTASYDELGCMCIQSRANAPRTQLGWAVFEKDLYFND